MTILLVEDEARISRFVKKGLELEQYVVHTACDGEAALKLAESNAYDLVIMDILLPKMTGLEVSKKLREKDIRTPIIMLTAGGKGEKKKKKKGGGGGGSII